MLAKLAYDIHSNHISESGKKYDAEFEKWWRDHSIESLFGSRSNWSRWKDAGAAISKVEARFSKHATKLPISVDALYAVSQLTDDELALCLENTYTRTSVTTDRLGWRYPKKPKPLINPSVTGSKIRTWSKKWRDPSIKQPSDPRRLVLATVKIHGSFFDFDPNTAAPIGTLNKDDVRNLAKKLTDALSGQDAVVLVENHVEQLCSKHDEREARAVERSSQRAKIKQRKDERAKKYEQYRKDAQLTPERIAKLKRHIQYVERLGRPKKIDPNVFAKLKV
jgi:hypothetical protein